MPDFDHKTAQARAIMHQAYLAAAQVMRGSNQIEIGMQDVANIDSLDAIVHNYMREITPENAIAQTSPRAIMTRTEIESAARAAAVDVADGRMRALEEGIREAVAELGRQAWARTPEQEESPVVRMKPDGTMTVEGKYHLGDVPAGTRFPAEEGFIGLRNGAGMDDPGNLWSVSGVGDPPPPAEGPAKPESAPPDAGTGEAATHLAGTQEKPL